MKNTKTSARQAALIAVLVLGSSAWLSAQTNQGRFGPPTGGRDRQPDNYGNTQSTQGQIGETEGGLSREKDNYTGAFATNSQSLQVTKINKASAIIGTAVKNQQGEALGKIRDIVIDLNSGQVAYIVLDSETSLFSAAKLHAVPLRAFQPDSEGTSLILNTDKAKLDSSESFAKDNWPGTATATWGAETSWKDPQGTSTTPEAYGIDRQHTNDLKDKTYEDTTPEPKPTQPLPRPEQ